MKRYIVALLAVLAPLAAASPAWAHEEINPSIIPTGVPRFLTLSAANEKNEALTKITLAAPPGVPFGETTREPGGWQVKRTEDTITWTGGSVKPGQFEQWGFEVEGAGQPGQLTYKITLTFADGSADDVKVPVQAVAGPAGSPSPGTTAAGNAGSSSAPSSPARATTALVLAIIAVVLALGAIAATIKRPKRPSQPAPDKGAPQRLDW